MNRWGYATLTLSLLLGLLGACCDGAKSDPKAEAPPPLKVESVQDRNVFKVDNPEQFPLTAAIAHISTPNSRLPELLLPTWRGRFRLFRSPPAAWWRLTPAWGTR